jgi:hypothetical protein
MVLRVDHFRFKVGSCVQITLPSPPSSQMAYIQKRRKMNIHKEMVVLLAALENGCLAFFGGANVLYDNVA